jgi:excisionase family DNA binding protein
VPRKTVDDGEVTPNQAAEILKMSRPSVMRLIENGDLHPRMVHSRHKLSRTEVEAYAEWQTRERRRALANLTELGEEQGAFEPVWSDEIHAEWNPQSRGLKSANSTGQD